MAGIRCTAQVLLVLALGGCAGAAPIVRFTPAGDLPGHGLPARNAAAATAETAQALTARGYVRLGTLEVFAEDTATAALLDAAARHGADLAALRIDNRRSLVIRDSRQQCVEVIDPGRPGTCLEWNPSTGVCHLWSAPIAFECGKWKTVDERRPYVISQADLWRREALAAAIVAGEEALRHALAAGEKAHADWMPLDFAADRDDAGAIRALCAAGARADARALGHAVRGGHAAAVAALLAAGAPVDGDYYRREPPPGRYTTPLLDAVQYGRIEIAGLLADRGANVNAAPAFGSMPLREAVTAGNLDMVRLLLARGADPRLRGFDAVSALEEAARQAQSAPAAKTVTPDYAEILKALRAAAKK